MNKTQKIGTGVALFVIASPAFANLEAITGAQTTLLGFAAALLALGVAVWAAMKIVRMFGGK